MNNSDFWQEFLHDGNNENKELLIMVSIYRLYMISFFINPIVYSVSKTNNRQGTMVIPDFAVRIAMYKGKQS
jgi:hypothetical protein